MALDRREFLARTGIAVTAGALATTCRSNKQEVNSARSSTEWDAVRDQFNLSREYIHMSALFIASHPKPVREAIEQHRRGLDENPVVYLRGEISRRESDAVEAAARYLAVNANDIALTDSTTMGLGLVYNGLKLQEGQELLTTEHDYYVTHESLRLAAEKTGAIVRPIPLYKEMQSVSEDEIVTNLTSAIGPRTRVVALTWVHSSTGLKLPLGQIAAVIADVNTPREDDQKVLMCVDGVHGFGVEDVEMKDLGCDFFISGCHKWLFGPRGTGIIWGHERAWNAVSPTIPTFMDDGVRTAWLTATEPAGRMTGPRMTPGGFKPFEHQWALTEAFEFHRKLGKSKIAKRTHALASQLKEGLATMSHITLHTPRSQNLSAGIVAFDVAGMSSSAVVDRLRSRRIVATASPYAVSHARLTPSIRNSPEEIEAVLREIATLS